MAGGVDSGSDFACAEPIGADRVESTGRAADINPAQVLLGDQESKQPDCDHRGALRRPGLKEDN